MNSDSTAGLFEPALRCAWDLRNGFGILPQAEAPPQTITQYRGTLCTVKRQQKDGRMLTLLFHAQRTWRMAPTMLMACRKAPALCKRGVQSSASWQNHDIAQTGACSIDP